MATILAITDSSSDTGLGNTFGAASQHTVAYMVTPSTQFSEFVTSVTTLAATASSANLEILAKFLMDCSKDVTRGVQIAKQLGN
jgi:hypothetical protein